MEDQVHRAGPPGARETRPVGSLRRFLPDTIPYRWQFVAAAFISLGIVLAQVAEPEVVKRYVDEVLSGKHPQRLVPYALSTLALGVVWPCLAFCRRHVSAWIAFGLEFKMRNDLYAHMQRLSVDFHDGWQSGELVTRAVTDIARIRRY